MELEINKVFSGFRLTEEKYIEEIKSVMQLFVHEKSGARLLNISNDDDNKVFSVTFRTPPEDSTGVTHIIEHSVLCGSKKFPTKEPFVELVKGSLNTFLNAFTFSDKTMYPIASKNDKDFYNLMDVYLDAVFYPNIYKDEDTFRQEGWHYELDSKDSELIYKGVVYNEMKGAFSSPEEILYRNSQASLFPDTPYGFESGGEPDDIPNLTYEAFCDYHKRYYHPANSYMFLYGNGDLAKQLDFINNNYLKNFDKIEVDTRIPLQKSFDGMKEITVDYPVSKEDVEEETNVYFSLNYVTGKATDPEHYLAMDILDHILMGTPASPLKKALLEAEIGKDVFAHFDSSMLQTAFTLIIKDSKIEKKQLFLKTVEETLQNLVKNGLDKKLVEASINYAEFKLREADFQSYPKGLIYNIKLMDSWLYGENPYMHLAFEENLKKVKAGISTDYFEKLIKKVFLDNTHKSLVVLLPKPGLAEENEEKIKQSLGKFKTELSEVQLQSYVSQTAHLKEKQNAPDTAENLATIPMLSLNDIQIEPEKLEFSIDTEKALQIIKCSTFTNNIAYINLYFDLARVPIAQIKYLSLLSELLGKIDTENYSYSQLSNEINSNTGEVRAFLQIFGGTEEKEFCPKLLIKGRALFDKLTNLIHLFDEIVQKSSFKNEKRLLEIIRELKSRLEMRIINEGHAFAYKRAYSYFSAEGAFIEETSGINFYNFIVGLERDFETNKQDIIENLQTLMTNIFVQNDLLTGITCDENNYQSIKEKIIYFAANLPTSDATIQSRNFLLNIKNEGFMTQGKVNYVVKSGKMTDNNFTYTAGLAVLSTILKYDYMWNKIRVQGGAYGIFAGFERNGNMFFASYRDPNVLETMKAFDETAEYLRTFDADDREMTRFIIGTISKLDQPLTAVMKLDRAAEYYIRDIGYEKLKNERLQILNLTKENIRSFADVIDNTMKKNIYCVLGSEAKLKENSNIFGSLTNIL